MTHEIEMGPGEAQTRRRRRRQLISFGFALALGAGIGAFLSFVERGEGSFFSSDFANLSLEPWLALVMVAAILLVLIVLPVREFGRIDELLREQNLIGMTGGCLAAVSGYPVWVMLYAGGFTGPPEAWGIFLLACFGTAASFAYAKLRT